MLLTSFAVTILLENLAIILFRPTSRPFPTPALLRAVVEVGRLRLAGLDLLAIAITAVLLLAADPLRHPDRPRHLDAGRLARTSSPRGSWAST